MQLFLKKDDGAIIKIDKIESVGSETDVLLLMCQVNLKSVDKAKIETELHKATGKQCVLLPSWITQIIGGKEARAMSEMLNERTIKPKREMEVIIKGDPKEIAALVAALQERRELAELNEVNAVVAEGYG